MKSLTRIIFALSALLAAANPVTAQVKIVQSDFVEQKAPMELRVTKERVEIAFDMVLEKKVVKSGQVCVLTPQFVRNGSVLEALPAVVIEGRNYGLVAREKKQFDKAALPCDAKEIYCTIPYQGGDVEVHYQIRVSSRPEFRGASLVLNQKTYTACGLGNSRSGRWIPKEERNTVLADGVVDHTAFRRNNPVAYYYPNRVSGSYENDFSNFSMFQIGRREIDMDAFARYGYTDFKREVSSLLADEDVQLQRIRVSTSASPEGQLGRNKELAEARADVISKYLQRNLALPADLFEKQWVDENWDAFLQDLGSSHLYNKEKIHRIIESTDDLDQREEELRQLDNWDEIFDIFQSLRNCCIEVDYTYGEHYPNEVMFGDRELAAIRMEGDPVLSVEKTTAFYEADPASITQLSNMMVALTEAGRYDEAETYAHRISNRNLPPVIANNKGVLYLMLGEWRMAQTMFEMAEGVPMADYNTGLMHLYGENYAAAAELLDRYHVSNSTAANLGAERTFEAARNTHLNDEITAQNYYMRAIAYAKDGEDKLALDALERAVSLDPSCKEQALNQAEFMRLLKNNPNTNILN